jgi:hypothetical protein
MAKEEKKEVVAENGNGDNRFFDFFGGRKMFLALMFVVLVTVAFFLDFMKAEIWTDALKWCLLIYLGANAVKAIPDALNRKK